MWLDRYVSWMRSANMATCCALALGAAIAWWLMGMAADAIGGLAEPIPGSWEELPGWLLLWLTGSVYSALVLARYVSNGAQLALVLFAGALSYWIGVQLSIYVELTDSNAVNVAKGGLVSACFIAFVCVRLQTHKASLRLFGAMAAVGAIGGAVIGAGVGRHENVLFEIGHGVWQISTCAVLHWFARLEN